MKRLLTVLLLMVLLAANAMAEVNDCYCINGVDADRVHLREEPSTQAESRGLYYTGTELSVLEWQGDWARVVIGEVSGYMMARYIVSFDSANGLTRERTASLAPWRMVDNTSSSWANLRKKPAMGADILSCPDNGTTVRVLGETADGWSYVKCDGLYGYVRTELLSPVELYTTGWRKWGEGVHLPVHCAKRAGAVLQCL